MHLRFVARNTISSILPVGTLRIACFAVATMPLWAEHPNQVGQPGSIAEQRREVDWRLPGGQRVRAIHDSPARLVPTRDRWHVRRPAEQQKPLSPADRSVMSRLSKRRPLAAPASTESVVALTIHSPPIDGFIPYIAVLTTDARKSVDEWSAIPSASVVGNYTVSNPSMNYGIGLFDTGAGVSLLSYANSNRFGLLSIPTYNTGKTITIGGVTGAVDGWVGQPIGLWMEGLGAIDSATGILNTTHMVGQWNVSVAMGPQPAAGAPDLATAIGSPLAVYYATSIRNDRMLTIERDDQTYDAPDINFYEQFDPTIPEYPNSMALELRPTGASDVMFWPCFAALEDCPGGDGSPTTPSLIFGASLQSLFFVSSVTLNDNGHTASDRQKFIIDTGAQITVIASRVAALLGLNPSKPDFTAEVEGVDGQVVNKPGFYLNSLEMPALGEWLSYTDVPVIMLDVASPESGVLDGIIGMNLFNRYNLVLRGGGMVGMDEPWLDFEPLPSVDADYDDDGDVDMDDFAILQSCFSGYGIPQTDPNCQNVGLNADSSVDQHDLKLFIDCARGPDLPAVAECVGL